MSWIVADSFDYYVAVADLARSVWDTFTNFPQIGTAPNLHPPRFTPGQCVYTGGANQVYGTKAIGSNEATIYVVCAVYMEGAPVGGTGIGNYFKFLDAGTAQFTIGFEADGAIVLKRGDQNGTIVATYAGATPQDIWQHFQFKVVVDPTVGSFTVRKNGSPVDTFSATGLNTRATANSYVNSFTWGAASSSANAYRIDDLLIFSGSGAAPNTWVGDVRAICCMACMDTAQKNFTAMVSQTVEGDAQFVTAAIPANEIHWGGTQPSGVAPLNQYGAIYTSRGGAVSKVSVTQSGAYTGHVKCALYYDDGVGGGPGTLYATSTELTNPAAGNVDFTFPAGTYMASNRGYFFGFITDASWTIGTIGVTTGHWKLTRTYATGFPATCPALTAETVTRAPQAKVTLTGNAVSVSELLANGDTDYVFSSNPTDFDLYEVADLPTTPQAVIGVVSKVYLKKSDAGARQGQIVVRSSATDVTSPDATLSTTYTYVSRVDAVDPATSVAWTMAGVNAMKVGQKVTS